MTTRQASKLLDALYEMIEEEWTELDNRDGYLEAIGIAQVTLRTIPEGVTVTAQ